MKPRTKFLDYAAIGLSVLFGAGSILLLIVVGSNHLTAFGWSDAQNIQWDVFLSFLFFAQHSVMVRRSFRRLLKTFLPARYDGAFYAIMSGIALYVVVIFWQPTHGVILSLQGFPRVVAKSVSFIAAALFIMSAYILRPFDPLGIGPIRAHLRGREYVAGPFVIHGPYRWVRHPLYSCILVMFWTNPDLTFDRLIFNVLWTMWIVAGAFLEERDLRREFGEDYRKYQDTVPMLIPWHAPRMT